MSQPSDSATVGAEIEHLVRKMAALGDRQGSAEARELVRLLMTLYGAWLSRMLDVIRTEQGGAQAVLDRLANDGLVTSLLVLHELHPYPTAIRVTRSIEVLQPHLPSHITLTLVAIDDDVVRVRVTSATPGHQGMPANLRAAIERAIQEAAPEIAAIDIQGMGEAATGTLIQIIRRADVPNAPAAS